MKTFCQRNPPESIGLPEIALVFLLLADLLPGPVPALRPLRCFLTASSSLGIWEASDLPVSSFSYC